MTKTGVTRRGFLTGLASLPALVAPTFARSGEERPAARAAPRVAVIGAGAFGGWTALHLLRSGARVELVDAWGPGNPRSSSGGESRVIRAIYGADRVYTEWVRRSFELWHELESASEATIYRETGSLWMIPGDDSAYVRAALPILAELGFPVDTPSLEEAGRRYPQVSFDGIGKVYVERRAGALFARTACALVRDRFVAAGGVYRTARARPANVERGRLRDVRLQDGTKLEADAFVFACGPWLGRLFPAVVGDAIRPSRQEVYYFGTPPGDDSFDPRRLPVWIDFGERLFYGLPDVHGRGFKIADDTRGPELDPTSGDRSPSPEGIAAARAFLGRRFPALKGAPLLEARVCQYENSPDGHLILDRHPEADNVWLAGGGSGHGFKLAPAVGEHVASCVLGSGRPKPEFALARLRRLNERSTQFESDAG